jgi:putative ABC transport system substrate-binding protein
MKTWSYGVVESWSAGSIRIAASLHYSNIPNLRRQLKFICLVLCAFFALCFPVQGQQPKKVPRIGFLLAPSRSALPERVEAFRQGLRELGYVEGQNIVIEYRYAEGKFDRLPDLAADLARLKVDVIVAAGGIQPIRAAKNAANTTPIVMTGRSILLVTP